jgi:hypothetical protein
MPAAESPSRRSGRGGRGRRKGAGRRHWLVPAVAGAVVLAGCSSPAPAHRHHHRRAKTVTTTSTTRPVAPTALCPLTGAPVPGGAGVPARPALAVKVDNYTAARPQSGLNHADIVYEEPVEGGITRYVAVFQCQEASLVGPVRSARNIDIGILGQFGHPLLAHVGGIEPVIDNIDNSPLTNLDLGAHGTIEQHPAGRTAPYDTYSSTAAMWGLYPDDTTTPAPVFAYSDTVPKGQGESPVATVAIPFSGTSNVVWKYDTDNGAFLRYYGTTPDLLATGTENMAANVVVQFVQVTYGPWVENATGGLEVQADLYTGASGPALVFRGGTEIPANWSRATLAQATKFTTTTGQPISLQPGQTWVELVPNTVTVTATPPSSPPGPTPTPPTTRPKKSTGKHGAKAQPKGKGTPKSTGKHGAKAKPKGKGTPKPTGKTTSTSTT